MRNIIFSESQIKKIVDNFNLLNEESNCKPSSSYSTAPSISDVSKGNSKITYQQKGDSVKEVQKLLISFDYDLGRCKADGNFGPRTKSAILDFKSNNNISGGGYVDKETLSKLKNPSSKKSTLNKTTKSFSKDVNYVVVRSDSYTGNNVHVFFGGAHSYRGGGVNIPYLKKVAKIVQPYSNNAIIILTHHANDLNNVKKFAKDKFNGNVVSIAGFSQGGRETWEYANDGSLKLVGLIDPSTYDIDLSLGPNTYLLANPTNWGGYAFVDAVRKRLTWYCKHKDDSKYKGKILCPKVSHWGFIKYFYDKFGSRI